MVRSSYGAALSTGYFAINTCAPTGAMTAYLNDIAFKGLVKLKIYFIGYNQGVLYRLFHVII
jgi:hypothetical protein